MYAIKRQVFKLAVISMAYENCHKNYHNNSHICFILHIA